MTSKYDMTLLGLALFAGTASAQVTQARLPYLDPTLPVERRIDDLLGRMTLEEKIGQMLCLWQAKRAITDSAGRFDPSHPPDWFRIGVGRIERPGERHSARAEAEYNNAIQRWVKEHTRLGIPVMFHEEALHGLEGEQATSFPQAIALASTWNPELVERVFTAAAAEARARGVHQVLAPVVDVARDPRWGRIEETYGEDPYLAARMGVAAVRGFQGGGRDTKIGPTHVFATLKHMAGHGQPESGTNVGPAPYGERTLRDVFLYPFEVTIKEGGARSVMPSYNEVDGIPSHANRWLLHDVLRGEWGFDGVIVSDWFAIAQLADVHHVVADRAEAARRALAAGVDVELPDVQAYGTLVDQVRAGRVAEASIDSVVRRLLRPKFELGLFESPFVDPDSADRISGAEATRALALDAARQAIILLKNDRGTLPLSAERLSRVAVIGPHAAETLLGEYSGTPRHVVSIVDGIRARLGSRATVEYAEGTRITEDSTFTRDPQPHLGGTRSHEREGSDRVVVPDTGSNARRRAAAVALARRSEVAIVVVGDNEMTSREAYATNHLGDRATLGLPGDQEELVRAVLATGTRTILVLIHGRPLSIPNLVDRVPAILDGWYLGQETGTAVAGALFGDVNPGGKLPLTVARHVGQLPVFYNAKPSARRGYVFDTTRPLFPFGFGLSYTTFAYANLRVAAARIRPNERTTVSVDVTNTGTRAGDEVVQLYIRDVVSFATQPVKQLRGFRRVTLQPGETRTITFDIGPDELAYHGADMKRVVEPGQFDIMVGGNSVDLRSVPLDVVEAP
ncbi:MAG TPA: glycoside hydrolase family 3 N-terminal domain-containing protein [Gemmatimonadales bacterium]|nr:glycoside hydrolase family 3 N-terminal domain-containing protein [Gemmatimonadales bacterium]